MAAQPASVNATVHAVATTVARLLLAQRLNQSLPWTTATEERYCADVYRTGFAWSCFTNCGTYALAALVKAAAAVAVAEI
jgi:hypothetical protein